MKNTFSIGIIILALIGVGYFMMHTQAEAPVTINTVTEQQPLGAETIGDTDGAEGSIQETTSIEAGDTKTFTIFGTNFAFDMTEIRVQEGDTVTIEFESTSGFHDWVIDEFSAATKQVRPGTPTSVTFVADTAGTYEYYCSVGAHRANGMVGTLIVE